MAGRKENIQLDLHELENLIHQSNRPSVKGLLLNHQTLLRAELASLLEEESKAAPPQQAVGPMCKPIAKFAWEQDNAQVKVHVTSLPGTKALPPDNIQLSHDKNSVDVKILDLGEQNYRLHFRHLSKPIESCRITLKSSGFTLTLKKKDSGHWDAIEAKPSLVSKPQAKPGEESGDPSASLMNMMREMYENGDDDMKRTIAEAWTKSKQDTDAKT